MKKKSVLLLFMYLIFANQLFGQLASFRNFSVEDGLGQSQVYSVIQDHKGYLWFGTRGGGLSRFDGQNFESFTDRQGLVNNYIYSLKEDSNHTLWIGTNDGLSSYNGQKIRTYKHPKYANHFAVFGLTLDSKDKLWLATNHGVFTLKGDSLISMNRFLEIGDGTVNAIFSDSKGVLWMGTGTGLLSFQQNGGKQFTVNHGFKNRVMRNAITCLSEDQQGKIWIGTYGDGAYVYNRKDFYRVDLHHELYKQTVFNIFCDENNVCWIASLNAGLVQYDQKSKEFTSYTERNGLGNNHVRSVIKDTWGDLWIGTSGGGVSQFAGKLFSHYSISAGLGGNFIYSIYRDSSEKLWFGTSQNGVSVYENGVFSQLNVQNGFDAIKVKAIIEDNNGLMYFGTEGQGIGMLSAGGFSWIDETRKYYVRQMSKDKDGVIWVATSGSGLIRISEQGKHIENVSFDEGLLHMRLTSVFVDSRGLVWYGAESAGLACYDPKTRTTKILTKDSGLSADAIRSIVEDSKGRIWVGTAGAGINCVEYGTKLKVTKKISIESGLHSSNVYLMVFDVNNHLILGSESGLDILDLNETNQIKSIKHYGKSDGFLGVETCQNSVWKDKDGKIWFGTINGASCYNLSNLKVNKTAPILSILDIQLFYESLSKTKYNDVLLPWNSYKTLHLPHDQNHLSFLFRGINLKNPEGVEYSWKMSGFENKWSPWTKEQRIVYSNMSSGKYTFLLRSRNEDGFINPIPESFSFTIATPFWKTAWFIFIECILGGALIWFIIWVQTARIRRKAKLAQKDAEFARNLLELEQKALRLQMNPHFIFNALNSIQGLIGTENETKARYYLAKFSRLMRQILDNSRNTTISLEEEISTLENYLLIEQFCNGNRFEYEIIADLETELNFIQIPPMLIQPFVENAIKHGFKYDVTDSRTGKITCLFQEVNDGITCVIRDNGIGREAAGKNQEASNEPQHISRGFNVTKERLDLLSTNSNGHKVRIVDLYDDDGIVIGTEVQLFIPL
ncbi:ligand-binding sensor domain-containing protein [Fluviicola taffensis]|uniref:Signal transduction histidine kinase, LytS n=1 Tax=Fluviicola taffensis (strain DSM 16823 / NCIMB 13979 / RW262) TaxID=755732 RepID=F2ICC0_FLUTR|nr:sensor histidine kinase [Fluviicola taffensis]AEA44366.1 signal transduction histidine kinase, LytS [Fluviicola taffensis DSM 16823]